MKPYYQKQSIQLVSTMVLLGCISANAATAPVTFIPAAVPVSTLPGIESDDLRAAISAFERSCAKYISQGPSKPIAPGYTGTRLAPDYSKLMLACAEASALLASRADQQSLLAMLDKHFEAVEEKSETGASLLTAYYEPTFLISKEKIDGSLDWPLYRKPSNLPIGAWVTRQAIETGQASDALKENVLSYTDRWSAYVLQIQGSGVGVLPDGTPVRLVYSGKNGQPYSSIGKALVERGEVAAEKISMQEIKSWLNSHSREDQDALYWRNQSYIFFEIDSNISKDRVGPPGAMNLDVSGLTPWRSAAVDWAHFVPGMPLFIKGSLGNGQAVSQLVIAQDRGGAITSKVRVDLFLGAGEDAADTAGKTRDENLKLWTLQFRKNCTE